MLGLRWVFVGGTGIEGPAPFPLTNPAADTDHQDDTGMKHSRLCRLAMTGGDLAWSGRAALCERNRSGPMHCVNEADFLLLPLYVSMKIIFQKLPVSWFHRSSYVSQADSMLMCQALVEVLLCIRIYISSISLVRKCVLVSFCCVTIPPPSKVIS